MQKNVGGNQNYHIMADKKILFGIFVLVLLVSMPVAEAGWWSDLVDWVKDLFGFETQEEAEAKAEAETETTTELEVLQELADRLIMAKRSLRQRYYRIEKRLSALENPKQGRSSL